MTSGMSAAAEVDEQDVRAAQQASEAFRLLLKGIKNIGIYRHAENRFPEFLQPAFEALNAFLEEFEILPLKLLPYTLEYKKQVIYEDQDKENLTYKFYRDGMRFLLFRRGLPIDELLRFVLIAISSLNDRQLFNEDTITRLWKENFSSIEWVVVENFGFSDMSEEEVEIEVEKIVAYLKHQLSANNDDITRFARLSAEDLELQLDDVDQVRGGIISGRTATPADKAWVQEEIYQEEKKRLFAKMVLIVFQILELDAEKEDHDMILDAVTQVLDTLLVSEDIKGAVALLQRFEKISMKPLPTVRLQIVNSIRQVFRRRMVEPQRLDSVKQYITLARPLDQEAVKAYLSICTEEELIPLVEMLTTMERAEGRAILIDVLAQLGKTHVDVFARRLEHNSSNVVKDMLAIIHKINPDNKYQIIAKCLEHPNVMIRLEGLKTLAKSQDERSLRYIEKAMKDEDIQMRLGACRALAARTPRRAMALFIKMMQDESFLSRDNRERIAIVTALGETKTDEALEYLSGIFEQKAGLFSRGKINDYKSLAIIGLLAHRSVSSFKVLAREVQNKNNPKEILEQAHKAALRLKQELEADRGQARRG
jgi:hypothetical protein